MHPVCASIDRPIDDESIRTRNNSLSSGAPGQVALWTRSPDECYAKPAYPTIVDGLSCLEGLCGLQLGQAVHSYA